MNAVQKKTLLPLILILILSLVLSACGSGFLKEEPAKPPAEETVEVPAEPPPAEASSHPEAAVRTIFTLDGGEQQIPLAPPATFPDLISRKVERGEWERGEGIMVLLKTFAGEIDPGQLEVDFTAIEGDASDVTEMASDYLDSPETDSETASEIERLLRVLIPTQEILDRISQTENQSARSGGIYHTSASLQDGASAACAGLEDEGFDAVIDSEATCYLYREIQQGAYRYRVYYPAWWKDEPDKLSWVDDTMSALQDSAEVYTQLGDLEDINIVFSPVQPDDLQNTLAYRTPVAEDQPCPITILPKGLGGGTDRYQQTLAHEIFHCFQAWNMTENSGDTGEWWEEGSAEYFSNVVFPSTNDEHRFLDDYHNWAPYNTWFEFSYENFLLFQYLGNQLGNETVIQLLQETSAKGGIPAQQQYLTDYPNLHNLFQNFVVATLSTGIPDTSGEMITYPSAVVRPLRNITTETREVFPIEPFAAGRFGISYQEQKLYLQQVEIEENILHASAPNPDRRDPAAWGDLPEEVRSFCEEDHIYVLAATTLNSAGTLAVEVTEVQEASCDPCLLGTWQVDNDSFTRSLEEAMNDAAAEADTGDPSIQVQQVTGEMTLSFNEKGRMHLASDGLNLPLQFLMDDAVFMETRVKITADGAASYTADGEVLTGSDYQYESEGTGGLDFGQFATGEVTVKLTLPQLLELGSLFGAPPTDPNDTDIPYQCSDDTLHWMTDRDNPLLLRRVRNKPR